MKKNFVEELYWRGMLHSMTPGTEEQLKKVRAVVKKLQPNARVIETTKANVQIEEILG